MGNYSFRAHNPQVGEIVVIKQDRFSKDHDMPSNVLYEGSKAKVIHSGQIYQSRTSAPQIDVTTVMLPSGKKEAYLTVNIQRER